MRSNYLFAILVGFAAVAILAADASAMYHPTMGRFMQRDPGPGGMSAEPRVGTAGPATGGGFLPRDPARQYRDGMDLYEYVRSQPLYGIDPSGLGRQQLVTVHGFPSSSEGTGEFVR